MRRGREAIRGSLFHAESRFSQTAWAADRWLPVVPGGEQALALAVGALLVQQHGKEDSSLPPTLAATLRSADIPALCQQSGVQQVRVEEAANRLASAAAPVVVGGASIVQKNSLAAVSIANALNILLGNIGRPGGVMAPSRPIDLAAVDSSGPRAKVVFLDGVTDASIPPRVRNILEAATVISFGSSKYADVVLPDHDALEANRVVLPTSAPGNALTGGPSFVRPLYDTRATEDVLANLAKRIEKSIAGRRPAYEGLFDSQDGFDGSTDFVAYAERQGGWWEESEVDSIDSAAQPNPDGPWTVATANPSTTADHPLTLQVFSTVQFGDGAGADLPWLRQLPDPASSLMFDLPLEIDPGTATSLGVRNGDRVKVSSSTSAIEVQVYVNPAAIPGVASLGLGGATDVMSLLAGESADGTGSQVLSCAVRIETVGSGEPFVQFTRVDRNDELVRL